MSARKHRLVDCNPKWAKWHGDPDGTECHLIFDCPEGHDGCRVAVAFQPRLDGTPYDNKGRPCPVWQRTGDTFETLTLSPSILQVRNDTESPCALHIFVNVGRIEFCGDSR